MAIRTPASSDAAPCAGVFPRRRDALQREVARECRLRPEAVPPPSCSSASPIGARRSLAQLSPNGRFPRGRAKLASVDGLGLTIPSKPGVERRTRLRTTTSET